MEFTRPEIQRYTWPAFNKEPLIRAKPVLGVIQELSYSGHP